MTHLRLTEIQNLLLEHGLASDDPRARELAAEVGAKPEELEEFFGNGPIESALRDSDVTEILINGPQEIWVERCGFLERVTGGFSGEESLRRYVRRILSGRGRKVDHRMPFADCTLADGSRLHVAIPPVSRKGICLSIRKFRQDGWTLSRLEQAGMLDANIRALLESAIQARKNIFVCGGTGSGKTSLLGALVSAIPSEQRIIALEDIAELRCSHPHFLSMEARPANQEGEGAIVLGHLLRESLRMRPDRIVIGECRGPEALDLVMALNTGHRGSMATIHANSPREALHRLETLAMLAGENFRDTAIRHLIASSVDFIVFIERKDRQRRIAAIAELKGVDGGNFLLKESKF